MYNNKQEILRIAAGLEDTETPQAGPSAPSARVQTRHDPCLPSRLPSAGSYFFMSLDCQAPTLSQAFLQREADTIVPRTLEEALSRRTPSPSSPGAGSEDEAPISPQSESSVEVVHEQKRVRRQSLSSVLSTLSTATSNSLRSLSSPRQKVSRPWSEPEVGVSFFIGLHYLTLWLKSYEVMSAIERKDLVFLMEVRDRAFHVSRI